MQPFFSRTEETETNSTLEPHYTVAQVAEQLQCQEETIRIWLRRGRIKGVRLAGSRTGWRVAESEIIRLLKNGVPLVGSDDDE